MTPTPTPLDTSESFRRRVRYVVALVVGVLVALFVLWTTRQAVLLAFLGIALGVAFYHGSHWITRRTGVPRGVTMTALVLVVLGGLAGAFVWGGPLLVEQGRALADSAPTILQTVQGRLGIPVESLPIPDLGALGGQLLGFLSNAAGVLTAFLVVLVVAIYTGASPDSYTTAVVRLFDKRHQPFVRDLLSEMGRTLVAWIKGVAIAVAALGTIALVGLTVLGLPGAIALAVFAALLTVIPTFGPLIGWAPAVLVGFSQGTTTGLITLVLAIVAQQIEGSIITPKIQGDMINVGPMFIVAGQIVLGALAGFLGILLVVPVLGVAGVAIKQLYIGPFVDGEPAERLEDQDDKQRRQRKMSALASPEPPPDA